MSTCQQKHEDISDHAMELTPTSLDLRDYVRNGLKVLKATDTKKNW